MVDQPVEQGHLDLGRDLTVLSLNLETQLCASAAQVVGIGIFLRRALEVSRPASSAAGWAPSLTSKPTLTAVVSACTMSHDLVAV